MTLLWFLQIVVLAIVQGLADCFRFPVPLTLSWPRSCLAWILPTRR